MDLQEDSRRTSGVPKMSSEMLWAACRSPGWSTGGEKGAVESVFAAQG